jgi:hypothetical protein
LEKVTTPQERTRLLAGLPSVAAYFILRTFDFGILEAFLAAAGLFIGLGFAVGLFKRKKK